MLETVESRKIKTKSLTSWRIDEFFFIIKNLESNNIKMLLQMQIKEAIIFEDVTVFLVLFHCERLKSISIGF